VHRTIHRFSPFQNPTQPNTLPPSSPSHTHTPPNHEERLEQRADDARNGHGGNPVGRAPEPETEPPATAPVLVAPAAPVVGTPMPTSDLQAVETEAMTSWSMGALQISAHLEAER
jgi:hypothetical protein